MKTTIFLVSVLCLAGCSWVKTQPGAETVALVKEAHVAQCKKLGTATSSVKHKLAGLQRKQGKVADELINLAKNEAHKMGGDTLLALSAAKDGSQEFAVYRCVE